jgi:hypothetical protein
MHEQQFMSRMQTHTLQQLPDSHYVQAGDPDQGITDRAT